MKRGMVLVAALTLVVGGASVVSAQGGSPPGGPGGAPRMGGPGGGGMGGQRGGGGGQRRGGGFGLLDIKEVQQELKLTPAQITKLQAAQQALRPPRSAGPGTPGVATAPGKGPAAAPGKGPQAGPPPQGPGGQRPQMSEQDREKRRAAQEKAIAAVLDAKQVKRFHQLEYQRAGAAAFALPEVATQLKITDAQKKQITAIMDKARSDQQAATKGVNFQSMTPQDRQALITKFQAAQKATSDKIIAVLTATQKKQWTAMLGTPFKFPAPAPRGGGPGGGGRGQAPRAGVTL